MSDRGKITHLDYPFLSLSIAYSLVSSKSEIKTLRSIFQSE